MANLIALVGHKQSGKDTSYRLLAKLHKTVHRFALADELKKEVAHLFETSVEKIEEQKSLWRPLLQWYGTEYVQQILEQKFFWCSKLNYDIEYRLPDDHVGIITDMRFVHEYEYFREIHKLVVIRIVRPSLANNDTHASELGISSVPHHLTVVNTDMLQLEEQIHDAYIEACNWFDSGDIPGAESLAK